MIPDENLLEARRIARRLYADLSAEKLGRKYDNQEWAEAIVDITKYAEVQENRAERLNKQVKIIMEYLSKSDELNSRIVKKVTDIRAALDADV